MVYVTQVCCVYSEKPPDDGQRNCPKHVVFCSKNKFEKLVHLIGFIIRFFHDARSPERQIYLVFVSVLREWMETPMIRKPSICNIHYTLGRPYTGGRVIAASSPFETSCIQKRGSIQRYERNSLFTCHLLMSTYLGNVSVWQNVVSAEQFNSNIPLYCLYCVFCIVSFMHIYSYLFCLYLCKEYCHRVITQLQLVVTIIIIPTSLKASQLML